MTLLGIKEGGKAVHYYQTKTDKCNSFQMGIEEDTVAMMEAEEEVHHIKHLWGRVQWSKIWMKLLDLPVHFSQFFSVHFSFVIAAVH